MRLSQYFFILILAVSFCRQGWAYIPPSFFVVQTLISQRINHPSHKAIQISSTVKGIQEEQVTGVHFKVVTSYDVSKRILRSYAYDDSKRLLYSVEQVLSYSDPGGASPHAPAHANNALLFDTSSTDVIRALIQSGVSIKTEAELLQLENEEQRYQAEVMSLGRWKGLIAWIVGKSDQSQLWIEKDVFQPIRLIKKIDGAFMDLRFENYRSTKGFSFPHLISLVRLEGQQEKTLLRDEVTEVLMNHPMDLKQKVEIGFTEIGNSIDSSVRDLIRVYFQQVR